MRGDYTLPTSEVTMPTIVLALASALVKKGMDFVRYVANRQWNGALTQAGAWVIGVAVIALLAHADVVSHFAIQGFALANANGASQVLLGLALGSGGSILADFNAALDTNEKTTPPSLLDV